MAANFEFLEFRTADSREEPHLHVRCRYGAGQIETSGGGGYFEEVVRPYLPTLTVWRGPKKAYQHKIPLMLDGLSSREPDLPNGTRSVETQCAEIELMAGVLYGDPHTHQSIEPPKLILDGYGGLPHDFTISPEFKWVILEPPVWGEALRDPTSGERYRQELSVIFAIYNESAQLRREQHRPQFGSFREAKKGDTYTKLAARYLHDARLGTRLAQFNNHRNGWEAIKAGTPVRMPDSQQLREWKRTPRR